jgi:hypothetical protein
MIATAGAQFNRKNLRLYFMAATNGAFPIMREMHGNTLLPIEEIREPDSVLELMDDGVTVMIDSGVFSLVSRYASETGRDFDEVRALPLKEIPGYAMLYERYITVCETVGNESWGYVEIDLGSKEDKMKTRAKLEKHGLRPIPVWHPMTDGQEYFHYLAKRYDRICMGNLAMASSSVRKRLIATVHELKRGYPDLWVHSLGMSPNCILYACPTESCDSSSWGTPVRWTKSTSEWACGQLVSYFEHAAIAYQRDAEEGSEYSRDKISRISAMQAHYMMENWRAYSDRFNAVTNPTTHALLPSQKIPLRSSPLPPQPRRKVQAPARPLVGG